MKTFRDAGVLLVLLLLLTSVKIAPVDGPSSVVPTTRAASGPASQPDEARLDAREIELHAQGEAGTVLPLDLGPLFEQSVRLRTIEAGAEGESGCTSMVFVFDTDGQGSPPRVLRVAPDVAPEAMPVPAPPRHANAALTACRKG